MPWNKLTAASAFQRFLQSTPSTPVSPSALIPHHLHHPPSSSGTGRPKVATPAINTDEIEHIDKPGEEESRIGKGWLGDVDGYVQASFRRVSAGSAASLLKPPRNDMLTSAVVFRKLYVYRLTVPRCGIVQLF